MKTTTTSAALLVLMLTGCARASPAPAFGLLDDRGRPWALADQHESVVLTFGYTHCPDTCPMMLGKLSRALALTNPAARRIEVAFVTVDPQRDTPRVLHAYLSHFGTQFVGLSGTTREIEAVERSYHVWAQRLPSKHGAYDYDEAHSATMFFINKSRNIVNLHDANDSVADIVDAMHSL